MDIMTELDTVEKIKESYKNGDIVMSKLLRNEEFSGMTNFSKRFLLKWAGEDDLMTVDSDGNIIPIEETKGDKNECI